jgi:hypothetical protein
MLFMFHSYPVFLLHNFNWDSGKGQKWINHRSLWEWRVRKSIQPHERVKRRRSLIFYLQDIRYCQFDSINNSNIIEIVWVVWAQVNLAVSFKREDYYFDSINNYGLRNIVCGKLDIFWRANYLIKKDRLATCYLIYFVDLTLI